MSNDLPLYSQPLQERSGNIAQFEFPLARPMPYYVKTAFGTAGDGTWRVSTATERSAVLDALRARQLAGNLGTFLVQDAVQGTPEVVQSIFRKGALMLDYIFDDATGGFWFIDPNPRIGETMNAVLAGNNLPRTFVNLTCVCHGKDLYDVPTDR